MEEYKRFEFHYGIILLRTRRFQSIMDRLGSNRLSKPTGWFLLYFMPVAAAIGLFLFLSLLGILLSPRGPEIASNIRTLGVLANLGLPGINPYLPVVDGWIALVTAMVIHEGAHGIVARSLGMPVKSAGLLFFLFVPIGAFVDVDEGALKAAKASYSGRVLASGASVNFVVGVACLLLLTSAVGGMTTATGGAGIANVADGGPAFNAGIRPGDMVTSIDGTPVQDLNQVIGPNTALKAGQLVNLSVYRDGATMPISVKLACCITIVNATTNQTISQYPYIGVSQLTHSDLEFNVGRYSNPFRNLAIYLCIPTLPNCQPIVPFSDSSAHFYVSPLGAQLVPVANLLYWLFFINFNLAIFNSLPIYPLDGGQAFRVAVQALARGRLSERNLSRITSAATLLVVGVVLGAIVGPYFL